MKKGFLTASLVTAILTSSFAQNYISGTVSIYGTNTASGATTVASGALLTLNKNRFYEQGAFINRGDSAAISADSGTLVMSGTTAQILTGRFKLGALQLANSTGATINSSEPVTMITILDSVHFGNIDNGVLNTGSGLLTLRSTAAKTARVADLTNNGSNSGNRITGQVIAERYLRSRRAWHLLCPPTTGDSSNDQTIQAAWQEGARAARGQMVNPNPGYGTVITRPGSSPIQATGYDDGISGATIYSMRMYQSNGQYTQPLNTDFTRFSPRAAYLLFVRGDRSVTPDLQTTTNHTAATITTLRSKGALHNGDVTDTVSNLVGSFAGIANPYACTIDFSKVQLSGITNGFYTWDPSINTYGAWIYIDGSDNYNATPAGSGAYTNAATNKLIQSGQAILVKTTGTQGTLTFHESAKNITSRADVFRSANPPAITVNLYGNDSDHVFMDGTTTVFDEAFSRDALPDEDIAKPGNMGENLSFFAAKQYLIKEKWPKPANDDSLFLRLWRTTARAYTLSFAMRDMENSLPAYLVDNYTKSHTPISAGSTTAYNFVITADSASKAIDRFTIVFGAKALPVMLTQLKAAWDGTQVNVQWNVQNQSNISYYEVERSTDGMLFTKIGTVAAHGGAASFDVYTLADAQPANGDNFYRVKIISQSGNYTYSDLASASVSLGKMSIAVYPNPVKNGLIKLAFTNAKAASYEVLLYSSDGKMVQAKTIVHAGGTSLHTMPAGTVAQGLYHAVVKDKNGTVADIPVVIE